MNLLKNDKYIHIFLFRKMSLPFSRLPPDINVDEKKMLAHKFDSILLLLFVFLLTLTVLTIWLFKHRLVFCDLNNMKQHSYEQI